MTERTVFMHDRSRCQIPVEFFDYYCELGLLVRHKKNRKVARLRSDLKAKRDKVNGGLLFWVLHPEPIEKHSYGSNYQNVRRVEDAWIEEGGQPGWNRYDRMQSRYRETYQTRPEVIRRWKHKTFPVECRACGKKYEKIGTLAGWSGLCQACGRSKKFNKLLSTEIQAMSERRCE